MLELKQLRRELMNHLEMANSDLKICEKTCSSILDKYFLGKTQGLIIAIENVDQAIHYLQQIESWKAVEV